MRWRMHNERPEESLMTALIAIRDDADEHSRLLLGIYYWQLGRWIDEESGRPISHPRFWWIPERELIEVLTDQHPDPPGSIPEVLAI